jgi:hypothetical protein
MKRRFAVLCILFAYLNGCSDAPNVAASNASQTTLADSRISDLKEDILPGSKGGILPGSKGEILPGSKGEILPGSKGEILPGSKGDRNILSDLEVQVRLPDLSSDFAVQSEHDQLPLSVLWQFKLDQQLLSAPRLLSHFRNNGELVVTVSLENVPVSTTATYQEVLLLSSDGIIQAAAVIPALKAEQSLLEVPITIQSTAIWMMTKEYEKSSGQSFQSMSAEDFQTIEKLPELQDLAQAIEVAYKESKGRSDPTKNQSVKDSLQKGSQKLIKTDSTATSDSANSSNKPEASSNNADTKPGQDKKPQSETVEKASGNESKILSVSDSGTSTVSKSSTSKSTASSKPSSKPKKAKSSSKP